jgi:hypothetical protein
MYWYGDNILPKSLFDNFHKEMMNRFDPNRRDVFDMNDKNCIRIRAGEVPKDDYMNVATLMGSKSLPEVITIVKKYLTEDLNFVNPEPHGTWFQYMSNKQSISKHYDNAHVGGKSTSNSFSAFLYMHQTWEDNWGGELCFNSGAFLPKSNRLIVYSRDEQHWVGEIKHKLDDYQRMFVAIAWGTD